MTRLYRLGILLGILIALIPLLMDGVGTFVQWRLHRRWTQASAAAQMQRHRRIAPAHFRLVRLPGQPGPTMAERRRIEEKRPAQPNASSFRPHHDIFKTDLVRLLIPKIHLDSIVMPDVTPYDLARGPGHYPLTDGPGDEGNCAIAAHRNMWGWWFDHLNELRPGDEAIVETLQQRFVYRVTGTRIVRPSDTAVLDPHGHEHELTLITCTHPATRRIVVSAELEQSLDTDALPWVGS